MGESVHLKKYTGFIMLSILLIALTAGLSITVLKSQNEKKAEDKTVTAKYFEGKELPIFKMTTTDGKVIDSQGLEGKPTVIMEWASWCPHCQDAMPIMNKKYLKYKDKVNFVFLNANGSSNGVESKEKAAKYIKDNNYQIPFVYDMNMESADLLKVDSVPTYFFVDKSGKVQNVTTADLTSDDVEKLLAKIMS